MKFTLKKRSFSGKEYSFHKSHTLGAIVLPDNFIINSIIPDQDANDCTAFQAVGARDSEIPHGNFDPEQFWHDELKFAGVTQSDGFDLGVPAAVGCSFGFSPMGSPTIRESNASAYFWITANSGMDLFDSVRTAIYTKNYPASGGVTFMSEWVTAPQGLITNLGKTILGGHAIRIAGWKTLNGVLYLGLPNTWGTTYGDAGWYWMTREVFNKAFLGYGIYIWSDDQSIQIKLLGKIQALYQNILSLLGK